MEDFFTKEEIEKLFQERWIVDARNGGLVIGRKHNEGGIEMLRQLYPDNIYSSCGVMEGGEYILCHEASLKHKERIDEINAYKLYGDGVDLFDVCKCNIILTKHEPCDKYLLTDHQGQFIVNKRSTSRFLRELDCINRLIR